MQQTCKYCFDTGRCTFCYDCGKQTPHACEGDLMGGKTTGKTTEDYCTCPVGRKEERLWLQTSGPVGAMKTALAAMQFYFDEHTKILTDVETSQYLGQIQTIREMGSDMERDILG